VEPNSIWAIRQLLEVLLLNGRVVTIDAIGFQKKIAQCIGTQGGD
jgi:predicted transposase YbfD/YdcC